MRLKAPVLLLIGLFISIQLAMADKSYRITISSPAKAGSVELQPGEYKLVLDDSSAHFTDMNTGKELEVLAKIDNTAETKFENTTIHSSRASGAAVITEIRLRGTKTRVAFP